jgi:hypothetical protein
MLWTNCNNGKMVANPNKTYTSQRRSKFAFVVSLIRPSMAIFINNVMYYAITRWVGNNINIQQNFHIFQNLGPFCFHKLCQFHKFQMPFKDFGKIIM